MEQIIGLKDLRLNMEKYAREIHAGKTLVVVKRSKPLFKISPIEDQWEEIIDFTKIRKGGMPAGELLSLLKNA